MRFYRLSIEDEERDPVFFCTFDAGKGALQGYHSDQFRREKVFLDLVEYVTDQKSICAMLNQRADDPKVLKSWALTNRGGVVEIPVEVDK